jgi:plasmid stabilization system protein ParE
VRIDFHPAATEELLNSAAWYKERSEIAAVRFAIASDETIAKIAAAPERFVKIDSRHRSCGVTGFPFQIVFRHEVDRIYIVAVAHAKRRPNYWQTRR